MVDLESLDITSVEMYAEHGYPWKAWDALRREAPVHWYEAPDYDPFWAITRHEDILTVSRNPSVFTNTGRLRIFSRDVDTLAREGLRAKAIAQGWDPEEPMDMIFMDDPRHREFRLITSHAFTPGRVRRSVARMKVLAEVFAREFDEALARNEGQGCATDLVREFSVKLPQAIICEMLGLPSDDWSKLLQWTNALVGAPDADFLEPDEPPILAAARASDCMRDYFLEWIERCRSEGIEGRDLTTNLLAGEVEGKPLTEQQLQGYLTVLTAAGSETTRNALTGGVMALLQHRDELARLQDDPRLISRAVEEILRWTSPVIQFARTATSDFELAGTRIRKGEDVGLFYPSANRDEAVFPDPYRFDVGRSPNHHLAFGHGSHFCMGANLARQELVVMLEVLLPRLSGLEISGDPVLVPHLHVGGIKSLHVRRIG